MVRVWQFRRNPILTMTNSSEPLGNVFQALADPTRRAVVFRLGAGSASTKELAEPFDMALPSFMQHLALLENVGLITSKKVGRVRTWELQREALAAAETWFIEQRAIWEARTDLFVSYVEEWYQTMTEKNLDFIVSRIIKAPRSYVWKAWTMPEHLEKWWTPRPMTAQVIHFDPRPGGAFDLIMRDPDGGESPITGAFLELIPEERIVFTTALTADWRPAPTLLPITAIISMSDAKHGTQYDTRVLVRDEEERLKLQEMGFEPGWSLGIDQLEELVTQWE